MFISGVDEKGGLIVKYEMPDTPQNFPKSPDISHINIEKRFLRENYVIETSWI